MFCSEEDVVGRFLNNWNLLYYHPRDNGERARDMWGMEGQRQRRLDEIHQLVFVKRMCIILCHGCMNEGDDRPRRSIVI